MQFRILGPLQVVDDRGVEVPVAGGRERAVLVLLLLSAGRVVSSQRLIDDLWGGRPPADPAHALRVHVSRLRRALRAGDEPAVLFTRAPGYIIEANAQAVDLGRFHTLVDEARLRTAAGDHAAAATTLRAALALWRGPALADVGDSPFLRAEAERLDELRLAALEDRIEADLASGRHIQIANELDTVSRAHPTRERLRGLLMLCLYRAGRPADALRAFQELRSALREDLGLDPAPALVRLQGAILRHAPELDWSLPSPPAQAVRSTNYARTDGVRIAYQVVGDGPVDLVFVPGFVSNVDSYWDSPGWVQIFDRLSRVARLILWDKRGTGLSDPVSKVPTLDERADDLLAVMDAAGSERPVLFGISEGGPMALLFAATHPERVRSLVLYGVSPRFSAAPDWPHGFPAAEQARLRDELDREWGSGALMDIFAPTETGKDPVRQAWARVQRAGASPTMGLAVWDAMMSTDCRDILPAIRVPTLVLHRLGDRVARIEGARHIASQIPGARLVERPGDNHLLPVGEVHQLLDEVEQFLSDDDKAPVIDRILTTIVWVDLGGAADEPGEGSNRGRLPWPDVASCGGRHVIASDTAFVASFAAPSRAVTWASTMSQSGPGLRIGIHTGECEVVGDEVRGQAVAVAAGAAASAPSGELRVTGVVRDLLVGSGFDFADCGVRQLPGVPGDWVLCRPRPSTATGEDASSGLAGQVSTSTPLPRTTG